MNLKNSGCEDGNWMEPVQYHVQWWALVVKRHQILLSYTANCDDCELWMYILVDIFYLDTLSVGIQAGGQLSSNIFQ
jgi:hypothetical protein